MTSQCLKTRSSPTGRLTRRVLVAKKHSSGSAQLYYPRGARTCFFQVAPHLAGSHFLAIFLRERKGEDDVSRGCCRAFHGTRAKLFRCSGRLEWKRTSSKFTKPGVDQAVARPGQITTNPPTTCLTVIQYSDIVVINGPGCFAGDRILVNGITSERFKEHLVQVNGNTLMEDPRRLWNEAVAGSKSSH